MSLRSERVGQAALMVSVFATIIGFTDNFIRPLAAETGLWQFHVMRTLMICAIALALAPLLRLRLWPKHPVRVVGRSAMHGVALMIYFGALAFLPVAQVAAGLFTAPIWVLLISRFVYGHHIGVVRVAAVAIGFLGMFLVLGPEAMATGSWAAALPVVAGLFYAMGNVVTREWCADEAPETLALGFFTMMGVMGGIGLIVLTLFPQEVPADAAGFLLRGWTAPTPQVLWLTLMQAAGSLFAVALLMRAYLIAEASRVTVFEYLNLPAAAIWAYILWGEVQSPVAISGMVLIAAAGGMIALRGQPAAAEASGA